jgi:hypothetical protein
MKNAYKHQGLKLNLSRPKTGMNFTISSLWGKIGHICGYIIFTEVDLNAIS